MTVHTHDLDSIVGRIRKLMSLTADRGATEAEAALAAEHVQRMLAEHNLSMASIEATGASAGAEGQRVREGVARRQVYKWQRELMNAIAGLNYCHAFIRWQERGYKKARVFDGYDLIGRASNVATATAMFEYLLQTIERLARDEVLDPAQFFTRYAHSFKEGCADRLVFRLRVKQEEIVAESERKAKEETARQQHPAAARSNLPAIILSDVIQTEIDLNTDFIHGYEPGTTARRRCEREAAYAVKVAERDVKKAALIAAGTDPRVVEYMAWGYDEATARRLAGVDQPVKPDKPETDKQRQKREEREERDNRRYWERREREAARLDPAAYRKGQSAGDTVGLDPQIDRRAAAKARPVAGRLSGGK